MDGFENGNNPYEQENSGPAQAEDPAVLIQIEYQELKRARRWKALLTYGCILTVAGILAVVLAAFLPAVQQSEPVYVHDADMEEQYVCTQVQYLTDAVAGFDTFEQMQFYIALDQDMNPALISLHEDELQDFESYREWFYGDQDSMRKNAPEPMHVTGYAQPIDSDLKSFVIQGFGEIFGPGYITEDNFSEWFGSYYVQAGRKSYAYPVTRAGIYLILSGIVLLTASLMYMRGKPVKRGDSGIEGWYGGPRIEDYHPVSGILGALLGALLGGLLWSVVGALGFITAWVGLLIILFAHLGYLVLAHRMDILGNVVSILFGVLVIIPAEWLSYGWSYYRALNEGFPCYISLGRAFRGLLSNMGNNAYGDMRMEIMMGYFFLAAAGISWLFSTAARKVRENRGNRI